MSKHTPGPWVADTLGVFGLIREERWGVYANGAAMGARMPAECGGPEASANAHLIAAAPELLEACKRIAADGHGTALGDLEFLRAAIAKAEGES